MKWVLRLSIVLLIPVCLLLWLMTTESGLRWVYQQSKPFLPAAFIVTRLEGRLIGPVTLNNIEYKNDGIFIKADKMVLDWRPAALLTANIDIRQLQIQSLSIVLPQEQETDQALTLPEFHLPWRVSLKDVIVDDISISREDQRLALKQIRLGASTLFQQIDIEDFSIDADSFSINIKGQLNPARNWQHSFDIRWNAELPASMMITGHGQLRGDMSVTRLQQKLTGPLELTLAATINKLLDHPDWLASIDATLPNAGKLPPNWPAISGKLHLEGQGNLATAALTGSLDGQYPELGPVNGVFKLQRLSDNTIQLDNLELRTPAHAGYLSTRGQWIPGSNGGDVDLALDWRKLRWPLQNQPWFDSAIGSGWIKGNIDHYYVGLATDRPWSQAPPSSWYASVEGNRAGLNIHSLHVATMNGEALGTGQLDWSPRLTWKVQARVNNIDPASLWPQWPGQIKATLNSTGYFEQEQLHAYAEITDLQGSLRGYPVSLTSTVDWSDNSLNITDFDMHSGEAHVSVRGRIGETLDLDWTVIAADLAELYPQAGGQLQAKGVIRGPLTTPEINTSINATALHLPGYKIGSIDASVIVDLFRWQKTEINVVARSLNIKDYALQSLDIDANNKHLTVKAVADMMTALIEMKGDTNPRGWRGHIERADFNSPRFSDWSLIAPAALTIDAQTLMTESLCWHNSQDASICAALQHENEQWQSRLKIDKLPLMLLSLWLPPDLELDGVLNATTELVFQAPDQLQGHANIELPPGVINYPLLQGEHERWEYNIGKIDLSLQPQGLDSHAEIAMNNGDRFQAQLILPDVKLLALDIHHQPLQADVQMTINDLGLIEVIVPEVQALRGSAELKLLVTGTLAQPRLSAHADLRNGTLRIPRLGLSIDQVQLSGNSDDIDTLNFQLDARSGQGNLVVQGQTSLDRKAGWPTEISIKGKEFEVSRIPEAQVLVTPDLQIRIQNHNVNIDGEVHIPYAKLQPKDITTATHVSQDAVIISDEQASTTKWSIDTRVRLTLGDRVNFYGYGFDGRFSGSLLLEDEPGQVTKATGELNIPEGRYRAYGQRLDVEHGRILYTGGPLSNPGIDLRAVRHIGNISAGLKVKGSLNQPQIEVYSIPVMGQTEALAYLLLGYPLENASNEEGAMMAKAALAIGLSGGDNLARLLGGRLGLDEMRVESSDNGDQASLVIGRYLSPRLYASYGVGLIDTINTISLRYKISDKWQLKAESGEYQGADILYTIER